MPNARKPKLLSTLDFISNICSFKLQDWHAAVELRKKGLFIEDCVALVQGGQHQCESSQLSNIYFFQKHCQDKGQITGKISDLYKILRQENRSLYSLPSSRTGFRAFEWQESVL